MEPETIEPTDQIASEQDVGSPIGGADTHTTAGISDLCVI